jgi:hypothetical protein
MKNPAEEIVTAWLQECMHFFTMNNVKVPRKGGGMGAEIDILATDGNTNIWAEVSVSTNPRCNYLKDIRFESTINEYLRDFDREDKNKMVRKYFPNGNEKWLIYGKLALPRDEKERFGPALQSKGIKSVYFGDIFKELRELKGFRLDAARGYMNLFETFHNESI